MGTRTYIAEIEDPITGETTVLEADTPEALDTLVEEHLSLMAPADQENPASTGPPPRPMPAAPVGRGGREVVGGGR